MTWLHKNVNLQMPPKQKFTVINTKDVFSESTAGDIRLGDEQEPSPISSQSCTWVKCEGPATGQVRSGQVLEACGSYTPPLQGHHPSCLGQLCVSFLVSTVLRLCICHRMMKHALPACFPSCWVGQGAGMF